MTNGTLTRQTKFINYVENIPSCPCVWQNMFSSDFAYGKMISRLRKCTAIKIIRVLEAFRFRFVAPRSRIFRLCDAWLPWEWHIDRCTTLRHLTAHLFHSLGCVFSRLFSFPVSQSSATLFICLNLFEFELQEKPHKCSLCSKSFPTPGDLKSHMYVHSGSWPFKCHICSRGFSKHTNLKNHLFLHTGKHKLIPLITQCSRSFIHCETKIKNGEQQKTVNCDDEETKS